MTAGLVDARLEVSDDAGPAVRAIRAAAWAMPAAGLAEVVDRADLQTRVDRKYFVPAAVFEALASELAVAYSALEINDSRLFGYRSTYFDTSDLRSYRHHLQGRRFRFKVRVREYVDSGETVLEVKLKGLRGATIKRRISCDRDETTMLSEKARSFVDDIVREAYGIDLEGELVPTVETANVRATFISMDELARITCDGGVVCREGSRVAMMHDDVVLVETKSGPRGCLVDRRLRALGVRPTSVSKYCVGVAMLRPEMASNPWHRILRHHFEASTLDSIHP